MHEVGVNEDIFNRYYCIFYLRKFLVFFAENENDLTQDTFCNLPKKFCFDWFDNCQMSTNSTSSSSAPLNTGEIIGIVIGITAALVLVVGVIYFHYIGNSQNASNNIPRNHRNNDEV